VSPRAGLDDVEKRKFLTLLGFELRPLGRPARSQSISRLLTLIVVLIKLIHSKPNFEHKIRQLWANIFDQPLNIDFFAYSVDGRIIMDINLLWELHQEYYGIIYFIYKMTNVL
jgi:hypothetical protein